MPETDAQYADRQNFEVRRDTILGILGVLDVDQPFIEAIMMVPTLGASEIPKANPIDAEKHLGDARDKLAAIEAVCARIPKGRTASSLAKEINEILNYEGGK
jgi:hypothetical protein